MRLVPKKGQTIVAAYAHYFLQLQSVRRLLRLNVHRYDKRKEPPSSYHQLKEHPLHSIGPWDVAERMPEFSQVSVEQHRVRGTPLFLGL